MRMVDFPQNGWSMLLHIPEIKWWWWQTLEKYQNCKDWGKFGKTFLKVEPFVTFFRNYSIFISGDVMNETIRNIRTIHMSEFVSVENHLTQSTLLFFRDGLIVAEAVEGRQQLCAWLVSRNLLVIVFMLWESLFTNLWPWEEVSSLDWRFSFGWESGIGESWRSYNVQRTTLTDPSVRLLIIKGPVNWINDHRQEATLPRMGILVSLGQFEPLKILVLSHFYGD